MEEGARAVVVFNYASIGKNELKLRQAEVVRVEQVLSPDWILCTADNGKFLLRQVLLDVYASAVFQVSSLDWHRQHTLDL